MDIETLLAKTYPADRPGLATIRPPQPKDPDVSILRAHMGEIPGIPFFGDIVAIIKCRTSSGSRYFELRFHVWKHGQAASMANRITDVKELVVAGPAGAEYLSREDSSFGAKAFWLYTPNSELDKNALMLRSAAAALKRYSVDNKLCQKFRNHYNT